MITAEALIQDFEGMLAAGWGYIPRAAGEAWTQSKQDAAQDAAVRKYGQKWVGRRVADCSGAFVWACRQHGESIYHGSNRIAREYAAALLPIERALPGMAVFKAREPGEKNYALPAEYRQGGKRFNGDLSDYYHIGLVDASGRQVIHSSSPQAGFIRSGIDQGWRAAADLKMVRRDGGQTPRDLLLAARQAIDEALARLEKEGLWNT